MGGQESAGPASVLEAGTLPVEELAALAWREGIRPRAIYGAHKWFARRPGTAFRALLVGSATREGDDFWEAYYNGVDLSGTTVLDPFVGGGTSAVEALRLGASVIGVDVDPVACAVTRFETRAADVPDLRPALCRLQERVGSRLAPLYRTEDGKEIVHAFWVQVVGCSGCGNSIEVHPHYQLAYDAEGAAQWAFCRHCHAIRQLPRVVKRLDCTACGTRTNIQQGTVNFGQLTCPACRTRERLIDVAARTGRPPSWRLFGLEVLVAAPRPLGRPVPLVGRSFRTASDADRAHVAAAEAQLAARTDADGHTAWIPDQLIPRDNRSDDRLVRYGYTHYRQLFLPRQRLHLSLLADTIAAWDGPEREALALAFSDHLATNCVMTAYAFGWRRTSPLFSVRAFRHVVRPVEINPWLDGTGRGTYPNAVRQVQRAVAFARAPQEPLRQGGFRAVVEATVGRLARARVLHRNSENLRDVPDASVDLVLTDPPYFDNIAYSELADFWVPWLRQFGLIGCGGPVALAESLAAKHRSSEAAGNFRVALSHCFAEVARTLKPEGRLVFTYQHSTPEAWEALASALAAAGLHPVQLFPLLGDSQRTAHDHAGSSRWDAVFVAVKGRPRLLGLVVSPTKRMSALAHSDAWANRLRPTKVAPFRAPDAANFRRACLVAASLGLFGPSRQSAQAVPLRDELNDNSMVVSKLVSH